MDPGKKLSDKTALRWLFKRVGAATTWILLSVGLGLSGGVLLIFQARFLARIVHGAFMENLAIDVLKPSFYIFVGIVILRSFLGWARGVCGFYAGAKIRQEARMALLEHFFSLGPSFANRQSAGALASTALEHVEGLHDFYAFYLPQLALAVMVPTAILVFVFPYSWAAGTLLLVTAPLVPLFMILVGMGAESISQRHFQALARMSAYFLDVLQGLPTLKLFNRSKGVEKTIAAVSNNYRLKTMAVLRVAFLSSAVLEFFSSISIALVAIYLGLSYLGYFSFGLYGAPLSLEVGFFILLLAPDFYLPLRELGTHYHARATAVGAAEEILKILSVPRTQVQTELTAPVRTDVISMVTAVFLSMAGFWVPLMAMRLGEGCGHELAQHLSDLRIRIVEGLQGMPELLVFGAHHRHLDTVKKSSRALLKSQLRMSQIQGLSQALMTLISGLAVLATLYLAVILVNRGMLDGPIMALITLAVLASFEAVFPLPAAYQYLGRTREAGRRLLEIVNSKPEVIFPGQSVIRPRHFGVRFENVCFKYNQKAGWALRDVDFQIHPGRRVAVIGETGSGKSTLIHLLVRFSDPNAGCIQIGGMDVRNFGESDLRRHISVVAQQPHMFNATLRENLLMARPGAGEDELLDALKFAQLLSFVSDLPDGLDTWIGEAAKLLSGGQARRLAVARAILHNGPLWVLDEPTEGLDPMTEGRLMSAIKAQTAGRSLLLITHRLIDLHWMDDIFMLDKGRIMAKGTHEELLIDNSQYASMHRRIP